MFRGPAGLPSLMKEGASHFKGREEATLRNIDAARKLAETLKSSYGPNGMAKLVNNHIDKRFLSSDGTTILGQLEIQHPAAKILAMASEMQNNEFGDGTLLVVILAAELLAQASELIQEGVHESFIIKGYEMALAKTVELLEAEVVKNMRAQLGVADARPPVEMLRPVVASKIAGQANVDKAVQLIRDACAIALSAPKFNADNVRVTRLTGGNMSGDSEVVNGMVLLREPRTDLKEVRDARVIVLNTGIEPMTTEGTSTVLITKAEQMQTFTQTEEAEMKKLVQHWKEDLKLNGVICGGTISDIALHYLNEFNMWAVSVPSRFDLKRLSRTLNAPVLSRPTGGSNSRIASEDIGLAEFLGVAEYGGKLVTVIRGKDSRLATIVLRGMSMVVMEEYERCVDDCVSLVSASLKDSRFLPGGGHAEFKLAKKLDAYAESVDGIEQHAIKRFSEALKVVPRTLAENAGQNALKTLARLNAHISTASDADAVRYGVNICQSSDSGAIRDMCKESEEELFQELSYPVYDHYLTKEWAVRLACDAALTLLRIDQIIMSKPAGGPKMQSQGHWDAADDRQPAF